MGDEEFAAFVAQLKSLKDNKAIALFLANRDVCTVEQRQLITETFLIQCIAKIAGLENVVGQKIIV